MRQRGYLVPGLAVALAVAGIALWLTFNRLSACHEERARDKARFEEKLAEYDGKLKKQADAIKAWEERASRAAQDAAKALAEERMKGKGLANEAARLRALKGASVASECQAGEAVKRLREGLK